MSAQTERWFVYGEPAGENSVEAEIITAYHTGPNEQREDDVRRGTVGYDALEMMEKNEEIQHHTHDDGSVLLSGLSLETEDELLATFEENDE